VEALQFGHHHIDDIKNLEIEVAELRVEGSEWMVERALGQEGLGTI
jgi:hypothetical protein